MPARHRPGPGPAARSRTAARPPTTRCLGRATPSTSTPCCPGSSASPATSTGTGSADVRAGSRITADLTNLPFDADLVLYGPAGISSPPLRVPERAGAARPVRGGPGPWRRPGRDAVAAEALNDLQLDQGYHGPVHGRSGTGCRPDLPGHDPALDLAAPRHRPGERRRDRPGRRHLRRRGLRLQRRDRDRPVPRPGARLHADQRGRLHGPHVPATRRRPPGRSRRSRRTSTPCSSPTPAGSRRPTGRSRRTTSPRSSRTSSPTSPRTRPSASRPPWCPSTPTRPRHDYAAWDANPCSVSAANDVATAITGVLQTVRTAAPGITYVTLVGGDDILPMGRVPDLTRVANESDYAADARVRQPADCRTGCRATCSPTTRTATRARRRSATVAACSCRASRSGGCVETPAEIGALLQAYSDTGGTLDTGTAMVASYDFLADGASTLSNRLATGGRTVDGSLIDPPGTAAGDAWTSADLMAKLFPTGGASPLIASVNAHYDHTALLPSAGNAGGPGELVTAAEVLAGSNPERLLNRLLFTMGCHAGLAVPDAYVPGRGRRRRRPAPRLGPGARPGQGRGLRREHGLRHRGHLVGGVLRAPDGPLRQAARRLAQRRPGPGLRQAGVLRQPRRHRRLRLQDPPADRLLRPPVLEGLHGHGAAGPGGPRPAGRPRPRCPDRPPGGQRLARAGPRGGARQPAGPLLDRRWVRHPRSRTTGRSSRA